METIVKKKSDGATFANVQLTISKIEQFVKENGYQFKDSKGLEEITQEAFNANTMTIRKKKKLVNFMTAIQKHPTLENVNKFLHFLMKNILKSETRIKVIKSDKEIAIQEKRKAYKEALAKVQAAYADYKQEKGDFYKIKLSKTNNLNENA
jgi:hypothetical protein